MTPALVSFVVMPSAQIQKIVFINLEGALFALCSGTWQSPRVASLAGKQILDFTHRLLEVESNCEKLDQPMVQREKFCFSWDLTHFPGCSLDLLLCLNNPLVNGSLNEALENAEKSCGESKRPVKT